MTQAELIDLLCNTVAGGKGEGIVSHDIDNDKPGAGGQAARNSTANISDNSLGQDLSSAIPKEIQIIADE